MAIKQVFSCDRCSHEESVPKGRRGGVILPDGASIMQWRKKSMHLCKACAVAMDGFLGVSKPMRNQSEAAQTSSESKRAEPICTIPADFLDHIAVR